MAIDFDKWNKEFGGKAALDSLKKAKDNEYREVPAGEYVCSLEKLELAESKSGKPMVKAMFRIKEGSYKKQCLFYNGVMAANDPSKSGFCIHNVLDFLRDLDLFESADIDFDGDYSEFNELLLDMAEAAEGWKFEVEVEKDGDFNRLNILDTFQ